MMIRGTRTVAVALLLALWVVTGLSAQNYKTQVEVKGLNKPYGIALAPNGLVYFTELPEPGKSGGKNTVSVYDPTRSMVRVVVPGEPAPTNISVTASGDFYWTCQTADVILMRTANGTSNKLVKNGLDNPVGLSVTDAGTVYFTQVPTPGVPGSKNGRNTVSVLQGTAVVDLSKGEPEPVDVVADSKGNLYWTCRTAGVILRRDAATQQKVKVFSNLRRPTGIAMDASGAIYFTEVPTPGQPGSKAGSNATWKWDPGTENLRLIDFGDPEPVDITVSDDGNTIYWTCRSAGVIVKATPSMNSAEVLASGTTRPGDTVALTFRAAGDAGRSYQAATSFGRGPLPIDTRHVPLGFDALFLLSVQNLLGPPVSGYAGRLDRQGEAKGAIHLPSSGALIGVELYTAFVTIDGSAPSGIRTISSAYRMTIG